ncbi:hypothetical protein [Acetobacter papayae]|uniref:hypothetical protein n=1 Tax=Acetobacter papayae TaxID=1076592 RepID=UPI000471FB81|nr:hypothetical protein [Acetobacter papayae]
MSETLSAVQPTATPSSTMSGVLQAMAQQQQSVPEDQRGLADRLKELQEQLENDPALENDPKFATHVAWLMQDWPKFSGTGQAVQVSPLLHAGLNAMAGQYPGMSNPQMAPCSSRLLPWMIASLSRIFVMPAWSWVVCLRSNRPLF